MSIATVETESIPVTELYDLSLEDYKMLYVDVSRRDDIGSGHWGGVRLLNGAEPVGRFEHHEEALSFITDLESDGLIEAVRNQLGTTDAELAHVCRHLAPQPNDPDAFLNATECDDPMVLDINVSVETQSETASPASTSDSSYATKSVDPINTV